jgi:hypothetical protein
MQAVALCQVSVALAQLGDYRAKAMFDEAEKAALSIASVYDQIKALGNLAEALAMTGRFKKAKGVARSIVADLVGADIQASALLCVARALAQAQRFDDAEEIARSLPGRRWRAKALVVVATALAEAGNIRASVLFNDAERVARSIPDVHFQAEALYIIH